MDVYSCSDVSLQDALRGEHGRDFNGARIVVEWARGPKDTSAPRVRSVCVCVCVTCVPWL